MKQISLSPKSLMSVSNRAMNPHTTTEDLSLGGLLSPAQWLLCCFTPSARKTCAFVHVFHPLVCPLKGWFAVVMLLADWGSRSFSSVDAFKEARRARGRDVQKVTAYERRRKKKEERDPLGSQRSTSRFPANVVTPGQPHRLHQF